tara:strand:+ start:1414 stop:1653 length:240 start_codon:yes stop_codon:yes gene_type:complete
MGFHKRHIDNEQAVRLFNDGGTENIRRWYLGKVDALITETGLASSVYTILTNSEFNKVQQDAKIAKLLQKHIGVDHIIK